MGESTLPFNKHSVTNLPWASEHGTQVLIAMHGFRTSFLDVASGISFIQDALQANQWASRTSHYCSYTSEFKAITAKGLICRRGVAVNCIILLDILRVKTGGY